MLTCGLIDVSAPLIWAHPDPALSVSVLQAPCTGARASVAALYTAGCFSLTPSCKDVSPHIRVSRSGMTDVISRTPNAAAYAGGEYTTP